MDRWRSEHGQQRVLVGFRLVGADVALVTVGIVFGTGLYVEDFISAATAQCPDLPAIVWIPEAQRGTVGFVVVVPLQVGPLLFFDMS